MSKNKHLKIKVNCWFCNENSRVQREKCNGWMCNKCEQYNGFTPEGDYNTDIPGQHDMKNGRTNTVCEAGDFHTASTVLCGVCHNNQALYVRQLATFKSMNEESYDEELSNYKEYLEEVYKLCPSCEGNVKEQVMKQDQLLQGKLLPEHHERLRAVSLKKKGRNLDEIKSSSSKDLHIPSIPALLFQCCFLLTAVQVVICLRLYAVTVVSRAQTSVEQNAWFSGWMQWVLKAVPAYSISVHECVIHLGTVACLAGLFSCGKYSLYPEDCIHLSLRLLTLITWMEWLYVTDSQALLLSILTALFALVACCRPRKPRCFSQLLFSRKDISSLKSANNGAEVTEPSGAKTIVPEPHKITAIDSSSSNLSSPPFEEVCQDLETFSIGLCQKSGSKSSIWSLPSTIASFVESPGDSPPGTGLSTSSDQPVSPDSTTGDQIPPLRPGTPRSVLSPSRLGFIDFGSNSGSRSPSPWTPIMENSSSGETATQANSIADYGNSPNLSEPSNSPKVVLSDNHGTFINTDQTAMGTTKQYYGGFPFLQGEEQPVHVASDHQIPYPSKASQPSCLETRNNQLSPYYNPQRNSPKSFSSFQQFSTHKKDNLPQSQFKEPADSTQGVRRRSQRLAMAGKLPKPWPLRKSYSCNNATDRETIEKAGASARLEKLQAKNTLSLVTGGQDFTQYDPSRQNMPQLRQPQHLPTLVNPSEMRNAEYSRYRDSDEAKTVYRSRSTEVRGNQFSQYREGKNARFRQTSQSNTGLGFNSDPGQRNWFTSSLTAHVDRNPVQCEFSDAEDMDVDEPLDHSAKKQQKAKGTDLSLRWMLLGTVIGASITCNVFLILHGWIRG